jgi:hypothetical protein
VQDEATLARLAPALASDGAPRLRFVAVLWPHQGQQLPRQLPGQDCPVLGFEELLARGGGARAAGDGAPFQPHAAGRDDLATLVYTSGTTGTAGRRGGTRGLGGWGRAPACPACALGLRTLPAGWE